MRNPKNPPIPPTSADLERVAKVFSVSGNDGSSLSISGMKQAIKTRKDDASMQRRERRQAIAIRREEHLEMRAIRRMLRWLERVERASPPSHVRVRISPENRSRPRRKKAPQHIGAGRALPSYNGPIIDKAGRQGIFVSMVYDGAQRNAWGVVSRRIFYAIDPGHCEKALDGTPLFVSNMGETEQEIAIASDLIEVTQRINRKDAKLGLNLIIQLPHDVSPDARLELLREITQDLFGRHDLPFVAALHEPSADGDQRNYHAHIWVSWRPMKRKGPYCWDMSQDYRGDLDGNDYMRFIRRTIAERMTVAVQKAGHDRTYTHLSNAERGLSHKPQRDLDKQQVRRFRNLEFVADVAANEAIIADNIVLEKRLADKKVQERERRARFREYRQWAAISSLRAVDLGISRASARPPEIHAVSSIELGNSIPRHRVESVGPTVSQGKVRVSAPTINPASLPPNPTVPGLATKVIAMDETVAPSGPRIGTTGPVSAPAYGQNRPIIVQPVQIQFEGVGASSLVSKVDLTTLVSRLNAEISAVNISGMQLDSKPAISAVSVAQGRARPVKIREVQIDFGGAATSGSIPKIHPVEPPHAHGAINSPTIEKVECIFSDMSPTTSLSAVQPPTSPQAPVHIDPVPGPDIRTTNVTVSRVNLPSSGAPILLKTVSPPQASTPNPIKLASVAAPAVRSKPVRIEPVEMPSTRGSIAKLTAVTVPDVSTQVRVDAVIIPVPCSSPPVLSPVHLKVSRIDAITKAIREVDDIMRRLVASVETARKRLQNIADEAPATPEMMLLADTVQEKRIEIERAEDGTLIPANVVLDSYGLTRRQVASQPCQKLLRLLFIAQEKSFDQLERELLGHATRKTDFDAELLEKNRVKLSRQAAETADAYRRTSLHGEMILRIHERLNGKYPETRKAKLMKMGVSEAEWDAAGIARPSPSRQPQRPMRDPGPSIS